MEKTILLTSKWPWLRHFMVCLMSLVNKVLRQVFEDGVRGDLFTPLPIKFAPLLLSLLHYITPLTYEWLSDMLQLLRQQLFSPHRVTLLQTTLTSLRNARFSFSRIFSSMRRSLLKCCFCRATSLRTTRHEGGLSYVVVRPPC